MRKSLSPKRPKGFTFKKIGRMDVPSVLMPTVPSETDGLTGTVKGKDASDLEERCANALDKFGL